MFYQVPDYKMREEIGRRMDEGDRAMDVAKDLSITASEVNEFYRQHLEFKRDYPEYETIVYYAHRTVNVTIDADHAWEHHHMIGNYDCDRLKKVRLEQAAHWIKTTAMRIQDEYGVPMAKQFLRGLVVQDIDIDWEEDGLLRKVNMDKAVNDNDYLSGVIEFDEPYF